jgi:hypothetical protein
MFVKILKLTRAKCDKWEDVAKNEKLIKELKKEDQGYPEKKKKLRETTDKLIIEESSFDASIVSLTQKRGKEK